MKSWAREFALGLLLATAIPHAPVFAAQNAEQILLDKANYWRLKDRPDLAVEALKQLLSINPNHPDALYQYGIIEVQRGKLDDAKGYLSRLQRAAPSSPRIADLENAIRAGQVSPGELSEARRLAQSGQFSQAAEKYQQTFRGPPPPTFGVEYYMTLAGTPQRWQEARSGLESLVEKSPNDSKAKLALAEVLTFRGETRARGVRMLAQLSDDAIVGQQAARSWKQAMMWLGGGADDRPLYNQYLAKFPNDAEVRAHLAEVSKPGAPGPGARPGRGDRRPSGAAGGRGGPADGGAAIGASGGAVSPARGRSDALRSEGKTLESRADVVGAGARYQEAITVDPANPWARLDFARLLARQGDAAQAFQIVDPAASGATPDSFHAAALFYSEQNRVAEALALLDRIPRPARGRAVTETRERLFAAAEIDRAKQLARSGNWPAARNLLVSLYSQPPQTPEKTRLVAAALADIGDTQEALQLARSAVGRGDVKGTVDYTRLLVRAGRDAEAVAYLTQLDASGRIGPEGRRELERLKIDIAIKRADALRTRGDIAGAYDQISALLAAYPNDPNLLLAAGRVYASSGQNTLAMRFVDAAYRQAPGDLGVIRGAVGGAIVAGDLDRAQAYLAAGMQLYPNNPRLYYMAAEIARASGDNGAAVYYLDAARRLDTRQAAVSEPMPSAASAMAPGSPSPLPPNPFRHSQAEPAQAPVMLAAAAPALVAATDASPAPLPPAAQRPSAKPGPLHEMAESADSDDLVVPPRAAERPARPLPLRAAVASTGNARPMAAQPRLQPHPQMASLTAIADPEPESGSSEPAGRVTPARPAPRQLAQLEPLPPPPIYRPQVQPYAAPAYAQPGYAQPGYRQPSYRQPSYPQPTYAQPTYAPSSSGALQPLPPPPIQGYQPPYLGQQPPPPQDSLELDIERSMAAIAAESGPILQGGIAFRARSGEDGLSRLTEIGGPLEAQFSPFYTGMLRLQAVPTYLTAGDVDSTALTRFGQIPLLALTPGATLPNPGSQTAGGVALNVAYAYQMFSGEIGTTPLGFPVENLVGRLALVWPGPAGVTTAFPKIPLAPITASRPLQVKIEGARQPVTDSLLSYAGTKDPVSGLVWGGVIKTGGNVLVSYDDGDVGVYAGGAFWNIDGKSVAENSEVEGIVGAYIRPYRAGETSLKVGINLSYMGYDKNLRFFTFGQGGYFSPQTYLNVSVPVEYSGRAGRLTYLVGGSLGVQTFSEDQSPFFPRDPAKQAALQAAFGSAAFYPARDVTGLAFSGRGQVEYQLDNGFSVGGLAGIDNAQNFTEGVAKLYLRKSFGAVPTAAFLSKPLPGSL